MRTREQETKKNRTHLKLSRRQQKCVAVYMCFYSVEFSTFDCIATEILMCMIYWQRASSGSCRWDERGKVKIIFTIRFVSLRFGVFFFVCLFVVVRTKNKKYGEFLLCLPSFVHRIHFGEFHNDFKRHASSPPNRQIEMCGFARITFSNRFNTVVIFCKRHTGII